MRYALLASALILAGAAPAKADERPEGLTVPPQVLDELKRAEEAMRRGLEHAVQGFDLLIRSFPQYELPEINENGDIIIRRRPQLNPPLPPRRSRDII
jgi:hypothetical protein